MAFVLTLVYIFFLYARPLDLITGWEALPVMLYLGLFNIALTLGMWFFGSPRRRSYLGSPQLWLTFLFVFMAIFSWLRIGWWINAESALFDLQPMLGAFIMVVINVNTMKRLRGLAFVLVATFVYMAGQSVYSYSTGWEHDRFILEQGAPTEPGELPNLLPRLRHLGNQSDPNDFAQTLAVTLPLIALFWRRRNPMLNYLILLPTMGFVFWVIYLTHSRGGFVSVGLVVLLTLRERLGKVKATILTSILLGLFLIFNLSAGRAIKDSSSDGRIEAWGSGIIMLREHPLLGVGYNNFIELHRGLTAHNSYVLCFAEMGMLGYFVWMAMIVLTFMELTRLMKLSGDDRALPDIQKWAHGIRLALCGFLGAAYFLSRTYTVTLYLLVAMCLCLVNIARRQGLSVPAFEPKKWSKETLKWEIASIAMVWASVKLNGAA